MSHPTFRGRLFRFLIRSLISFFFHSARIARFRSILARGPKVKGYSAEIIVVNNKPDFWLCPLYSFLALFVDSYSFALVATSFKIVSMEVKSLTIVISVSDQ